MLNITRLVKDILPANGVDLIRHSTLPIEQDQMYERNFVEGIDQQTYSPLDEKAEFTDIASLNEFKRQTMSREDEVELTENSKECPATIEVLADISFESFEQESDTMVDYDDVAMEMSNLTTQDGELDNAQEQDYDNDLKAATLPICKITRGSCSPIPIRSARFCKAKSEIVESDDGYLAPLDKGQSNAISLPDLDDNSNGGKFSRACTLGVPNLNEEQRLSSPTLLDPGNSPNAVGMRRGILKNHRTSPCRSVSFRTT